jgi:ketosteroid isomerase-like protein
MSQENVEIVRRAYESVTAHLEIPQELFDPDWELDVTDVSPEVAGVLHGLEASEAMRPYWETFEAFHVEIEEVIHADEERVVDAVRDGGRIKGSEAGVWNRFFHVWTLRDGKVVRLSIHMDRNQALEAAGLSE